MDADELARALVKEIRTRIDSFSNEAPELVDELLRRSQEGGDDTVAVARSMLGLLVAHAMPSEPSDVVASLAAFNRRQDRLSPGYQGDNARAPITHIEWLNETSGRRSHWLEAEPRVSILTDESKALITEWIEQLKPSNREDDEPAPPQGSPSPRSM